MNGFTYMHLEPMSTVIERTEILLENPNDYDARAEFT